MKCAETAGFLIRSACSHAASGECMKCRKPICSDHQRLLEAQLVCIACYKEAMALPDRDGENARVNSRRSNYDYYDPYLYHQYYYSSYDPYYDSSFTPSDRSAFDRRDDPGAPGRTGVPGEGDDPTDFDGS